MNELNPIIIKLLENRGITDEGDILEFLSDKPKKTYDPFLLLNMEKGVDLILSGIKAGRKICIYGDYDADGITSVSLMTRILSPLSENLTYYVPSRFEEGYGLNKAAIGSIRDKGADIIITVDCGSSSYDEVIYAKELGLSVIVTDHHNTAGKIPECVVINPKQPGCGYPFKQLAGVGVAFKLAQAIQKKAGLPKSALVEVLDLVAIGTVGDIVPLIDENRTLVKYGLTELNLLKRKGVRRLAETVYNRNGGISSDVVAYILVPHLNAAGRMLSADSAVDILISDDDEAIRENVAGLVENNKLRKKVQEETYKKCVEIINKQHSEDKCLLIRSDEAHEGTAGIVAGKIKDEYGKPAIIVTPSGDMYKGTGRSPESVNLYELLARFEHLFVKFGGHAGACGFLIEEKNLNALVQGLKDRMDEMFNACPEIFDERYSFDAEIPGGEVTAGLFDLIERLAPFGNQNKKPVFLIRDIRAGNIAYLGEDGRHLQFSANCPDGGVLQCVLFNKAEKYKSIIESGVPVDIFGTIESQVWNNSRRIQFFVEKIA